MGIPPVGKVKQEIILTKVRTITEKTSSLFKVAIHLVVKCTHVSRSFYSKGKAGLKRAQLPVPLSIHLDTLQGT
jgi:hypothetical protein